MIGERYGILEMEEPSKFNSYAEASIPILYWYNIIYLHYLAKCKSKQSNPFNKLIDLLARVELNNLRKLILRML